MKHFHQYRMKQGFAAKDVQVANTAALQDVESSRELVGIDPTQVFLAYLAIGKVAEVAGSIAGVGNGDIADAWATMADQLQHVPGLGGGTGHGHLRIRLSLKPRPGGASRSRR